MDWHSIEKNCIRRVWRLYIEHIKLKKIFFYDLGINWYILHVQYLFILSVCFKYCPYSMTELCFWCDTQWFLNLFQLRIVGIRMFCVTEKKMNYDLLSSGMSAALCMSGLVRYKVFIRIFLIYFFQLVIRNGKSFNLFQAKKRNGKV